MQETLAAAMPKIMLALGHFANDGEIKVSVQKETMIIVLYERSRYFCCNFIYCQGNERMGGHKLKKIKSPATIIKLNNKVVFKLCLYRIKKNTIKHLVSKNVLMLFLTICFLSAEVN